MEQKCETEKLETKHDDFSTHEKRQVIIYTQRKRIPQLMKILERKVILDSNDKKDNELCNNASYVTMHDKQSKNGKKLQVQIRYYQTGLNF